MEETDVCYPTPSALALQQPVAEQCPAKSLTHMDRQAIAVQALAGERSITSLADEFDVSRKFVYQQADTAQAALDDAFTPTADDDQVLFELPVTNQWLRQMVLGLTLICHSSYRGVQEFLRDLFDVKMSVGTVCNIMQHAVTQARPWNLSEQLNTIDIAGLDEIFQKGRPVLVGADIASTYCFLLSQEDHRDADTWGVRLLELKDRGFAPQATIADFAPSIRAAQAETLSDAPCRGDVFHALSEIVPLVTYLENRAYEAIAEVEQLRQRRAKLARQGRRDEVGERGALSRKIADKAEEEAQAIQLADDMALLTDWLRYDILAVSGLSYDDRCMLFDFILVELRDRRDLCPHRLKPIHTFLKNHREQLLAFAAQLDQDLAKLAADFEVPVASVRQMLDLVVGDKRRPAHWQKEAALRQQLRQRFALLHQAVSDLAQRVVRASSVIENINSRLRNYFFLRRHLGPDYLALLQFFLNHRRFLRSKHAKRVDKSPAELLSGQTHPHWLEMLGYQRFSRN
jgi:hypothetical protein